MYEVTEFDIGYTVDLANRQCACHHWDLTGIPYRHVVCVLDDNQKDPVKYVASCFQMAKLQDTYIENISPVNGEQLWDRVGEPPITIPDIRRRSGRPKTHDRKKEPFESKKNLGKSTKHGRIMHCSKCKEAGHTNTGCKKDQVVIEGPKRLRSRTRKDQVKFPPLPEIKARMRATIASGESSSQPIHMPETVVTTPPKNSSSAIPAICSTPQPHESSQSNDDEAWKTIGNKKSRKHSKGSWNIMESIYKSTF